MTSVQKKEGRGFKDGLFWVVLAGETDNHLVWIMWSPRTSFWKQIQQRELAGVSVEATLTRLPCLFSSITRLLSSFWLALTGTKAAANMTNDIGAVHYCRTQCADRPPLWCLNHHSDVNMVRRSPSRPRFIFRCVITAGSWGPCESASALSGASSAVHS